MNINKVKQENKPLNETQETVKTAVPMYKNFYLISFAVFLVWITFFDGNNLFYQRKLKNKLSELESQELFYQTEVERLKEEKKELSSGNKLLEKFAREKYHFKRKGEDIYIVEEK